MLYGKSELYAYTLKKDSWFKVDVLGLFECLKDPEASLLLNLLHSSIAAKTLTSIAKVKIANSPNEYDYCFKPRDIIEWATDKEIDFPDKLREWCDKQRKPKSKEAPVYLDTAHPLHSKELSIAIEAWEAVLQSNPDKPKVGSRKQLVEKWLEDNHSELNQSEKERITAMINPDKAGGAPKSE